jgi:hypothetical protein
VRPRSVGNSGLSHLAEGMPEMTAEGRTRTDRIPATSASGANGNGYGAILGFGAQA